MKAGQDEADKAEGRPSARASTAGGSARSSATEATIAATSCQRAAVALAGIYAQRLLSRRCIRWPRRTARAQPVDGRKSNYTITLPGVQLPPVNAFWSVTMYDGKSQLLIANPINRYLINSPMLPEMKKNPDGAVTIYVSKDSPGADKQSNWLPAPRRQDLHGDAPLLAEGRRHRRNLEAAAHRAKLAGGSPPPAAKSNRAPGAARERAAPQLGLARISRLLRRPDLRRQLRQARTADALHALLTRESLASAA